MPLAIIGVVIKKYPIIKLYAITSLKAILHHMKEGSMFPMVFHVAILKIDQVLTYLFKNEKKQKEWRI